MNVCTIGNLTIDDVILYDEGQMYLGSLGGNALFAAIGARIWETAPTIIARSGIGYPEDALARLGSLGMQAFLKKVPFNDIHDWALYEHGGVRRFINHLTSGTHYQMSITGEELPEEYLTADGYHVAPMPTDVQATIVERLHKKNAVLAWDPHLDYLHTPEFNRLACHMLTQVDFFLPSQEEVVAMSGGDDLLAAASKFAELGPMVVVIKMSVQGSLIYIRENKKLFHVPIYPAKTVDPTGAGDAYCGAFLAGYLATGDPLLAACHGTVAASYVVEHVGALNTFEDDFSDSAARLAHVRKRVIQTNA